MHVSSLIVPLLTLSLATPISAAVPKGHGGVAAAKRHASHPIANQAKIKKAAEPQAAAPFAARGPSPANPLAGGKKGKRLVRKKRAQVNCQVPVNSTLTSSSAAASISSTTTADAVYVSASASASSSSWFSSAASSVASVIGGNNLASAASSSAQSSSATPSATSSSWWSSSAATTSTSSSATPSSTTTWKKVEEWSGNTFFDNVNFWSWSDPTHGTVSFQGASDAWNSGLISINSAGHAIMAVDTTQVVTGGRKAIRIHGNKVWTGGMVIMDAIHMPTGCGTWPAWWQNGPNWPYGGEIDILEGVNAFSQNQVSLHTGPGCTMPSNLNSLQQATLTTGSYDSYNCGSAATSNQGCGARDEVNDNSYGAGFNNIGGGVYAMVWATAGIQVYWFPRSKIPSDITNDQPDPSTWGTPVADFPSTYCSPYQFFYDHYNIFDTTFCGDWAGADAVWNYAGYAGQSQSCAAMTGYSTCSDFVLNSGSSFTQAYWEIASVKYYNSTSLV